MVPAFPKPAIGPAGVARMATGSATMRRHPWSGRPSAASAGRRPLAAWALVLPSCGRIVSLSLPHQATGTAICTCSASTGATAQSSGTAGSSDRRRPATCRAVARWPPPRLHGTGPGGRVRRPVRVPAHRLPGPPLPAAVPPGTLRSRVRWTIRRGSRRHPAGTDGCESTDPSFRDARSSRRQVAGSGSRRPRKPAPERSGPSDP